MSISRFEEIEAWQSARQLTRMVYEATSARAFTDDRDLRRQMRRAAASSMGNIAEGFDAGSDKEFQRFLRMAQRSATELQSHLHVAADQGYIGGAVFNELYAQAHETRRLIGGFIKYLQRSGRGTKD